MGNKIRYSDYVRNPDLYIFENPANPYVDLADLRRNPLRKRQLKNWHEIVYWTGEMIEDVFGDIEKIRTDTFTEDHQELRYKVIGPSGGEFWVTGATRLKKTTMTFEAAVMKAAIYAALTVGRGQRTQKWPVAILPAKGTGRIVRLDPGTEQGRENLAEFNEMIAVLQEEFTNSELRALDVRDYPDGIEDIDFDGEVVEFPDEWELRYAENPAGDVETLTIREIREGHPEIWDDPDFQSGLEFVSRSRFHEYDEDTMTVDIVPRSGGLGAVNVKHGRLAEVQYDPIEGTEFSKYRMVHAAGDQGEGREPTPPPDLVYVLDGKNGRWSGHYVIFGGTDFNPREGMRG